MIDALEAIARLRDGNARFVAGSPRHVAEEEVHRPMAAAQRPFATILGCSDSRVPVEVIFDQGVGDLFVIRVAGNIAAPSQIESAEFAARAFGTQLVVVLGHQGCGAVAAALDAVDSGTTPGFESILGRITPAVSSLGEATETDRMEQAVTANVRTVVANLVASTQLEQLVTEEHLTIIGAVYSLDTGHVTLLD